MLKLLRNKKLLKRIWIVLGIIIIPAFVFWGFAGMVGEKQEKEWIGEISGRKISYREFKDSLAAVKNTAIMRYGVNFEESVKGSDMEAQAWERLILIHEAKRLKIKVSDKEVVEIIESYPFFKRNGKFDDRLYKELLQYVFRTQARVFEEEQRQNIMISRLYQRVTSGVSLTEEDIRQGYIKINSEINPKFKFNEKKYLSEKKEFEAIVLAEKKEKTFLEFVSRLIK